MFVRENLNIREHYHVTRNCLEECLEDLLCNVLLMLMVMYRSLLVTPFVATSEKGF
jgi:hypothetical protein